MCYNKGVVPFWYDDSFETVGHCFSDKEEKDMAWKRLEDYRLPSRGCVGEYESRLAEAKKKEKQSAAAADQRAPETAEPQEEKITVSAGE